MGKNNILLTISLLVSNHKDTIRKTMDSIKPILDAVPSECIVVDTGGTDGSMDIVREYTNYIVPFTWCQNFSSARNAGLKHAKGEWFLFLDDDEWFEDVSEIIQFFNSGEYKNYGSALYIQRNYSQADGEKYVDVSVSRAARLVKESHFEGAVHEVLMPLYEPVKRWQAYVHHYGYVYTSKEEEEKKHIRNVSILMREMQKMPNNIRNHAQLAQEYGAVLDYEKGISVCRNALQKYHSEWNTPAGNWLMWGLVRMLITGGKLEEAWEEGLQVLNTCNPYELTRAHISYLCVRTAKTTPRDAKDLLKLAHMYFENMDHLEAHKELLFEQEHLSMTYQEALPFGFGMALTGVLACCQTNNMDTVYSFLQRLYWDTKQKTPQIMEEYKIKFPEIADALTAAMSRLPGTNAYLCLQRFIAGANQDAENLQELFDECVEQCFLEKKYYPQVLAIGVEKNLNFIEMFAILDQEDWENWVYGAGSRFTTEDYIKLGQIVERTLNNKNHIQYTAFLLIVQKYMVLQESALNEPDFLLDLEQFCDNAKHYFTMTYQEAMFLPENQLNLPRMCRFAIRMNNAFAARKAGKYKQCISNFREALADNPSMKDVVEGALHLMEEELEEEEKRNNKEKMRNEEFSLLAKQIKTRIRQLIQDGEQEEALQVIGQLQMLLPGDEEINALREEAEGLS